MGLGYAIVIQCLVRITWFLISDTSFTAWYQSLGIRVPRELGFGYPSPLGGLMWSIGIWKPMDRKFGLSPWLRKSITTRCGSLLSLGVRLPRKGT